MIQHASFTSSQLAVWQTATAVIQAVVSIILLGWYVLAAHLDRSLTRREKTEDYDSLVRLCRDLGVEAAGRTQAQRALLEEALIQKTSASLDLKECLSAWQADMTVIYICLNEVPHYEVRVPAFSIALTRLWLAVDVRKMPIDNVATVNDLIEILRKKTDQIGAEIEAMGELLVESLGPWSNRNNRLGSKVGRGGRNYDVGGFVEQD